MKFILPLLLILCVPLMGDEKADKEDLERWKARAEKGSAVAQYNVGMLYAQGQGVEQDYKKAFVWFSKAADQGYAKAQFNLGVLYRDGQGVEKDFKEAVKWYRKAADQGHAGAQFSLGVMCAFGNGVLQDDVTAYAWAGIAAANGYDVKNNMSEFFEKTMTPEQIAKAQALSKEMLKKNPKLLKD